MDPNNRNYKPSRARWISHDARQIQMAIANGAAPAVFYTLRNLSANLSRSVIPPGLDPHIPAFVQHDAGILERHTDAYAYESLNAKGRVALRATPAYHFEPIDMTTNHGPHAMADGYTRDGEITSRIASPTDKQTNKHMQLPLLSARSRSDIARLPVNVPHDSSVDTFPPGEIELTQQSPRNCATQQSSAHEEFGTHLNRYKSYSFSSNNSVASNSDSASTSPSIIVRADTPVSDILSRYEFAPRPISK